MSFIGTVPYAMWWGLRDKNNKNNIFNIDNSKKLWIFKWVAGWCVFVESNKYNYLNNSYFITPYQSKLTQAAQGWVGGETNTCFARSKSMDMNGFNTAV